MSDQITRNNIPDLAYAHIASVSGEVNKWLTVRVNCSGTTPDAEWCVDIEGKERRYRHIADAIAAYNAA